MTASGPEGLLLLDKPAGPTSQDAVTIVRRALGADKAGHAGTLDPFATGLLVLCLGRATKLAGFLTGERKAYTATVVFGARTDTDDATGKVVSEADASGLARDRVEVALRAFRGEIEQVPPDYSAVQRDGQRSYDRARRGQAVGLEPRKVTVHTLVLESFTSGSKALAHLRLDVSKGTYIRAIARDLGAALGVGGHLCELRRTESGGFRVENAVSLELVRSKPTEARARVVPIDAMPLPMPTHVIQDSAAAERIRHGVVPPFPAPPAPGPLRCVNAAGQLLAVLEVEPSGKIRFACVF